MIAMSHNETFRAVAAPDDGGATEDAARDRHENAGELAFPAVQAYARDRDNGLWMQVWVKVYEEEPDDD